MCDDLKKAMPENRNPITKRIVVLCKMRLLSPALIGSGENKNTDRDVYLDSKKNPILPGTSLAGVLRSVLKEKSADDKESPAAELFGPLIDKGNTDAETSPLWIFDASLYGEANNEKDSENKPAKIIVIDNVALDEYKVAKPGEKFDFEAIECGSYFDLRLQLIVRKLPPDEPNKLEDMLDILLGKLNTLYVGGKTSRGFGKLECESIHKIVFENDKEGLKNWMKFKWENWIKFCYKKPMPAEVDINTFANTKTHNWQAWAELLKDKLELEKTISVNMSETICALLKLKGSLLIRDDYSVEGDEDSAQITSVGKPVIYGTSMAGAIKGGLTRFLKSHGYPDCDNYLDAVFGYMDDSSEDKVTYPSKVRIDAAYFSEDKRHTVTRVKIDRWTGGAASRALFTTRPQFRGEVDLTIYYPKEDEAIRQLIIFALRAIDLGLITVGGETAIGRGVFSVEKVCINGVEQNKEALYKLPKDILKDRLMVKSRGDAVNG